MRKLNKSSFDRSKFTERDRGIVPIGDGKFRVFENGKQRDIGLQEASMFFGGAGAAIFAAAHNDPEVEAITRKNLQPHFQTDNNAENNNSLQK